MNNVSPLTAPTLTVTDNPTIGNPWLGLHAPMPRRMDNEVISMQPFVDIYSKQLELEAKLDQLLTGQAVTQNTLIILIEEYRALPWIRFWNWLRSLFARPPEES